MANVELKEIEALSNEIDIAENILNKNYLQNLMQCESVRGLYPTQTNAELIDALNKSVRFFDITKIVLDKNENMQEKLVTVFNAVYSVGSSILFQIQSKSDSVSVRFGINSHTENVNMTLVARDILEKSFLGNFPGTLLRCLNKEELKECVLDNFSANQAISCVTSVAGTRKETKTDEKKFIQGIEKLIDAMQGKDYSVLVIADPVKQFDLNQHRTALENLYSSLVPFSKKSLTFGENESDSVTKSISQTSTQTITDSIANSVSHTHGVTNTKTTGTSDTTTNTQGTSKTDGKSFGMSTYGGASFFKTATAGGGVNSSNSHSTTASSSYSTGKTASYSDSFADSNSDTTGKTTSFSESSAMSRGLNVGTQTQTGRNKGIQLNFEDHRITKIMKRIDDILARYDECADFGMWNCAMYCVSDKATAQSVCSIYHALTRGENSSLEDSCITVWDKEKAPDVKDALRHFEHPIFYYSGLKITPGSLVSSKELAIHAGIPYHSVPGIPVIECTQFGRTVASLNENKNSGETINIGQIFNMHQTENLPVSLSVQSLASHTFITGSTGAGKTNTVCVLLDELKKQGVKFLVVEPAKGEYKDVFEGDVKVFGTNPKKSQLLRINPFSFEKDIHILEHLDRLIEIFNVCWPLYAAMPAVLKEAVEKSYEDVGWNLAESENCYEGEYGERLFPNFSDVCRNIKTIIDNSEYDSDNKGAYKGSLLTRLKSLCNGINGLIFTDDKIAPSELFEKNVIVDLSRVGSAETKSLIMGLLVLKLQEYRMANGNPNNATLKHVTVLEEAHNLLKRTSTEQPSEGGNLLGKSVEMLTNSIAEMRSFGEGFIIADQAPALLDMAAIRNTNTKIIMRLPDFSDRELVGKAAGLNDDQIVELAKLPQGVAAVYQNDWVESVLCKVKKFSVESVEKKSDDLLVSENQTSKRALTVAEKLAIAKLLFNGEKPTFTMHDLQEMKLSARSKTIILDFMHNAKNVPQFIVPSPVIAEIFSETAERLRRLVTTTKDKEKWTSETSDAIKIEIGDNCNDCTDQFLRDIIQAMITQVVLNENGDKTLYDEWHEGGYLK